MVLVSNDPIWWPFINSSRFFGYVVVSASALVMYDCVLTLGQEIELIWRQRWSLMTVLYLSIRYIGILYVVMINLYALPVSLSDAGCNIIVIAKHWTYVAIAAMLGVIVIARLHAMYQGSRRILTFLIVIFLAVNIAYVVITAIGSKHIVGEELILSGTYVHASNYEGDVVPLSTTIWVLNTVWEVLALCFLVWTAVKHFRNLRQLGPSTGSTIGDCFTVLIKSHMLYFASFAAASCLQLSYLSPIFSNPYSMGTGIHNGVVQISSVMQMFVLGPRLILSVREYHAKRVTDSDAINDMISVVFQERVHVSTSSTV